MSVCIRCSRAVTAALFSILFFSVQSSAQPGSPVGIEGIEGSKYLFCKTSYEQFGVVVKIKKAAEKEVKAVKLLKKLKKLISADKKLKKSSGLSPKELKRFKKRKKRRKAIKACINTLGPEFFSGDDDDDSGPDDDDDDNGPSSTNDDDDDDDATGGCTPASITGIDPTGSPINFSNLSKGASGYEFSLEGNDFLLPFSAAGTPFSLLSINSDVATIAAYPFTFESSGRINITFPLAFTSTLNFVVTNTINGESCFSNQFQASFVENDTGIPVCGNGLTESGEGCDDGNIVSGDGCSSTCNLESCGNSVCDTGETTCNCASDCGSMCGDGCVNGGELCEPGQTIGCTTPDGYPGLISCNATCDGGTPCQTTLSCGDGIKNGPEVCDGLDDELCPGLCNTSCECDDPGPGSGELAQVAVPIVYVECPPPGYYSNNHYSGFNNESSTFANNYGKGGHPRGCRLKIRYPDESIRDLTAELGLGAQPDGNGIINVSGSNAISLGRPAVSCDGSSIGIAIASGQNNPWQLYEISGIGQGQVAGLTYVDGQAANKSNYDIVYDCRDTELVYFISMKMPNGLDHIPFRRDEYDVITVNTGLWVLNRLSGELRTIANEPSGFFRPLFDSYGRVLGTVWGHLVGGLLTDASPENLQGPPGAPLINSCDLYGAVENVSELPSEFQSYVPQIHVWPEHHHDTNFAYNALPTEMTQNDFSEAFMIEILKSGPNSDDFHGYQTINHMGRQDYRNYLVPSQGDGHTAGYSGSLTATGANPTGGFFSLSQSLEDPEVFYFVDTVKDTKSFTAGQIKSIEAPPGKNAMDQGRSITPITDPVTKTTNNNAGWYADPLKLPGVFLAAYRDDSNFPPSIYIPGSGNFSESYAFRIVELEDTGGSFLEAGKPLTSEPFSSYRFPDGEIYSGRPSQRWPVPVITKATAPAIPMTVSSDVQQAFSETGVSYDDFREFLRQNDLALIHGRNATQRDSADEQQPFNLRVKGTNTQSIGDPGGPIYDIKFLQIMEGLHLRGYLTKDGTAVREDYVNVDCAANCIVGSPNYNQCIQGCTKSCVIGGTLSNSGGRRIVPRNMINDQDTNIEFAGAPDGSVEIDPDGSFAAIVPAKRPVTWGLLNDNAQAIVRERLWLTFQPGEIRQCQGCHGATTKVDAGGNINPNGQLLDQAGQSIPTDAGTALRTLLTHWKTNFGP